MSKSVVTLRFDPAELAKSDKPWVRAALRSAGYPVGDDDVAVGVKLQKGGRVSELFEAALLADPRINRFDPRYNAISPLCQRWGKERDLACEEVKLLSPQRRAIVRTIERRAHCFRKMEGIRLSAQRKLFTVISTFAGAAARPPAIEQPEGMYCSPTSSFRRRPAPTSGIIRIRSLTRVTSGNSSTTQVPSSPC